MVSAGIADKLELFTDFLEACATKPFHVTPIPPPNPPSWTGSGLGQPGLSWVDDLSRGAATVFRAAIGVGVSAGCIYGVYEFHKWYSLYSRRNSVLRRYEDLCSGDPPGALEQDSSIARELDEEDEADLVVDVAPGRAPAAADGPPGFADAPQPERRVRRRKRGPGAVNTPYMPGTTTVRGAYLNRLVSALRAENGGITYSVANYRQIMRRAYTMMTEHGVRSYDIDRNLNLVANAVFYRSDVEVEIEIEREVLGHARRLRLAG